MVPSSTSPPAVTAYFAPNDGPVPLKVTGTFDYFSDDFAGPYFDPFGYYVGDSIVQLTDDDGPDFQSGKFGFTVAPGVEFGWFIFSIDNTGGFAAAAVEASILPIPLPPALTMLGGGVLVLAGLARRRRRRLTRGFPLLFPRRMPAGTRNRAARSDQDLAILHDTPNSLCRETVSARAEGSGRPTERSRSGHPWGGGMAAARADARAGR